MKKELTIEKLTAENINELFLAFSAPPYNKSLSLFEGYFREQKEGRREVYVAFSGNTCVGYVTLVWKSPYPHFLKHKIPEIKDLNVVVAHRRNGVGTKLIQHMENLARKAHAKTLGIGVGVTCDYDNARSLYPKLGYVQDGNGVYQPEGDDCGCLFLIKEL